MQSSVSSKSAGSGMPLLVCLHHLPSLLQTENTLFLNMRFYALLRPCELVLGHHPLPKFNSNTQEHKDQLQVKLPGCVLDIEDA